MFPSVAMATHMQGLSVRNEPTGQSFNQVNSKNQIKVLRLNVEGVEPAGAQQELTVCRRAVWNTHNAVVGR